MAIPLIVPLASAAVSIGSSIFGGIKANEAQQKAERRIKKEKAEMNRLKSVYSNLDTSNPYLNMSESI